MRTIRRAIPLIAILLLATACEAARTLEPDRALSGGTVIRDENHDDDNWQRGKAKVEP